MTRKKRNTENLKRAGRKPLVSDEDLFKTVKDYKVLDENNQIYPLSNSVWKEIIKDPIINNKLTESTVHKRVYDDWKDQDKSKLLEILSGGYVHQKAPILTSDDKNIVSQKLNDDPKIDTIKELHKLKKDALFAMAIKDVNIHKFNVSNFGPEELYAWKCSCQLDLTFVITSGNYCFQNVDIEIDGNKSYTLKSITEHSIFSIFENQAVPLGTLLQDKLDCSVDINNFLSEMFRYMTTIYFPQVIFISSNLELKDGLSLALYNKRCTEYSDMCLGFLSTENDLKSLIKTAIRYDVSLILEYFPGKNYFKTDNHRRFYVKSVLLLSQCCTLESFKNLLSEIFVTTGTECISKENIESIESLKMKVDDVDYSSVYVLENDNSVCEKPLHVSIKPGSETFIFMDEIFQNAQKKWIKAFSHDATLNANYLNNRAIDILKTICLEFLFWSSIVNPTSIHKEPATNFYTKFNSFTNIKQNQTYEVCDFLRKMIGFKQEVLAEIRILFPSKLKRAAKKTHTQSNARYIRQENWRGLIEKATRQFDEFDDPEEKDEIEIADLEKEKSIEENSPCSEEISINCDKDTKSVQTEVKVTSTSEEYELKYPFTIDTMKSVHSNSIFPYIPITNGEQENNTDFFDETYNKSHSSFVDDECTETSQIPEYLNSTDSFQETCVERVETLSSSDSDGENEKPARTLPNLDVDPGEESETERVWVGGSTDSLPQLYNACFKWEWRQLIKNGLLLLPFIEYEGKLYKLINTCPLDSIFEVMVACACFRDSFGNLVTMLHVTGCQSEIFSMIYEYKEKFSRQLYYQMRLKLCLDSGRYKLKHNNGYIQINCADSIDALYDYLFRNDHSITKRIKCDSCSHDNTHSFTTEHLDPYHVDNDLSLSTMTAFLEKKYSKSKKKCYNENCNGICTVSYKITEWFCVNVEPAYLLNENAYATLSEIPSSITVQRKFILTGIVAFDPPPKKKTKNQNDTKDDYQEKGLAHYYAYNRFTNGEWEKRDSLLKDIYCYSENTREKLKPALLIFVQENVTTSLL